MDTIAAQRAMRVAKSYLDETDNIDFTDEKAARNARTTLSLAAKQLSQAHRADPQATVDVRRNATVDIPYLRAWVLMTEARTWSPYKLSRAIELVDQATQAAPAEPIPFHMLGIYHLDAHNPGAARRALQKAAQLDPENPEILKDLDRAKNTSGLSVAAYKAADAGALTWNIFITAWNIFAITWNVLTFPMRLIARMMGIIK